MFRRTALAHLASPDRLDDLIEVTNTRAWLALTAVGILIGAALVWSLVARVPTIVRADGYLIHVGGVRTVEAPAVGRIDALLVQPGERIVAGQPVARIARTDGQVETVAASAGGRVLELRATAGNEVSRGAALLSYEQPDEPLEARLYLPRERVGQVLPGMTVQLALAPDGQGDAGVLLGDVAEVGAFPVTVAGLQRALGSEDLARSIVGSAPPVEVRVALQQEAAGRYRWRGGEPSADQMARVRGGAHLAAEIVAAEQPPIALVLGQARR